MLTAHPPPSPPPASTEVWASSPALYGATSPSPAHPHRRRAHSDDRFAEQGNITEKSGRAELSDFWRVLFWNTIGISSVVALVAPMRAGDGTREYHRRFSGCILLPLQLSPSSSRHILFIVHCTRYMYRDTEDKKSTFLPRWVTPALGVC